MELNKNCAIEQKTNVQNENKAKIKIIKKQPNQTKIKQYTQKSLIYQ